MHEVIDMWPCTVNFRPQKSKLFLCPLKRPEGIKLMVVRTSCVRLEVVLRRMRLMKMTCNSLIIFIYETVFI